MSVLSDEELDNINTGQKVIQKCIVRYSPHKSNEKLKHCAHQMQR
jgi:hypothetical protein